MSNTASSTTKHTPTPWRVVGGSLIKDEFMPFDRDEGETALIATASGHTAERIEANAAFIVRAANSHDQLVAALRSGHKAIDQLLARVIKLDPTFMPSQSPSWLALMSINEALSAAEAV